MIVKNFVGICVLTASLAFGFWGCSDSGSSKTEKETDTFSCFEYGDDGTQITGYKEENSDGNVCSLDVEIPDEITSIAEGAFQDKGLMSVEIPNSVTDIGANAFTGNAFTSHIYIPNESATFLNAFDSTVRVAQEGTDGCFEITNNALSDYSCMSQEITIPDGVTSIEDGAFEDKGLTSVTFPQTLTSIKANAFKDNDLMDLTLPDAITDIGDNAFDGNSNLGQVYIPNSNASVGTNTFPNDDYVLAGVMACFVFDSTNTDQINDYYANENNNSNNSACSRDVEIPQGVIAIGDNAFKDKSLTSVIIPDGVTSIGVSAFETNSLASVLIPDSVTSVETYAFMNNSLTSVTLGSGLTSISNFVFYNNSLESIEIPDSITSIGISVFQENSLTSIIIPDSKTVS